MFSSATMQELSRMMRGNFIEYNSEMALGGMRWNISCTYSCGSISNVRKTFKVKLFYQIQLNGKKLGKYFAVPKTFVVKLDESKTDQIS